MYHALAEALKGGALTALILGTDSPQLSPLEVDQAFEALLSAQAEGRGLVTFGPALDGGYVWVGINQFALPSAETLFKGMVWSTREVLQESLARAKTAGLDVHLGAPSWDIDEPADLARLFEDRANTAPSERVSLGGGFDAYELAPPSAPALRARYHDALERLYALTRFGERMDLETPRALNRALGDPLSAYQSVLVGGTNGKGSTTAYLTSLAEQAGLVTGRFSSPHLISFRERISLSGRPVPYELVIEGVEQVFDVAEREGITMSFFEATWALAAWCFQRLAAEWVIWEVGLGGRLDATNVCDPVVSAITSIGLDHMALLGETLEEIAVEKAHIRRPGRPALTGATGEGLRALTSVADQFTPAPALSPEERQVVEGRLHPRNAALALAIADASGWRLSQAGRLEALRRFEWPGRLEELCGVTLDCAHNPHAMSGLVEWLKARRAQEPERVVRCVFGASQDKDIKGVIQRLAPHVDVLIWVSAQYPRCAQGVELERQYADLAGMLNPKLIQRASSSISRTLAELERTRGARKPTKELDLVTGSCFVVGEARAALLGLPFPEADLRTTAR
jgi:dihydrofolate synthase/folylpolyglutamate synthase